MDAVTQEESTCQGCRDGILNQLGHMDEGGCLYVESEKYEKYEDYEEISKKNINK